MTTTAEPRTDPIELRVDITDAVGLTEPAFTAVSVHLPDPARLSSPPVVVFAFPGAGYGRRYFSFDLPGSSTGGQAGHHTDRLGWIVVTCDHLGVGDSSVPDPAVTTLDAVCAANAATVDHVLGLLRAGSLHPSFPAVPEPVVIGMGHSMGGCFTVQLQGTAPRFDAIAILGFGAAGTGVPKPDGSAFTFGADPDSHLPQDRRRDNSLRWAFHGPGVPEDIVDADVTDFPTRGGRELTWASSTVPGCVTVVTIEGVLAEPAARIEVPVFVGAGELDIIIDPLAEPGAYRRSREVTVHVQPGMAHMHNFAPSRAELWDRIATWVDAVIAARAAAARSVQ